MSKDFLKKAKAVVIGHAIGDALGVPVEFSEREALDGDPVTDMTGFGMYSMPKGSWSDDTSMALCALESLSKGRIDYDDIMLNFGKWYYESEFTPTGKLFDVGNTCRQAIENYHTYKMPYDKCGCRGEIDNGNGSLMRIHPIVLFLAKKRISIDKKIQYIHTASALTHTHRKSQIACGIYAFILWEILFKPTKKSVFAGMRKARKYYENEAELKSYENLLSENFINTSRENIKSGGYVVDTLEAAVWCLLTTDNYKDCVLKAVNLGSDTDTVAAIAGGLAGALYGLDNIQQDWKDSLIKLDFIENLCQKAYFSKF